MRAVSDNYAGVRSDLENERAHLLQRIDELTATGEVRMDFDDDFSDRGFVASEQGKNETLAGLLQSQLALVERALERLEDGTYGTCSVCGGQIGAERLEAMSATDRCIEHVGVG